MSEEPRITMTEFKTVIENFQADLKKVAEGVLDVRSEMSEMKEDIRRVSGGLEQVRTEMKAEFHVVKTDLHLVKEDIHSLKEQVALLHEGQTEIKNELTQKVGRDEFGKLEVRVARLESKAA